MNLPVRQHQIRQKEAILLCVALLITGCAELSTAMKNMSVTPQVPVLDYYRWVKTLPDSLVLQENEKLLRQQSNDPVIQQVQLAILFSIPPDTSIEQDAQAITALDRAIALFEVAPDQVKQGYQQFALIWRDILEQQRQYKRDAKNMSGKLKELIAAHNDSQKKIQMLQEQIEALKSIEQQINERDISQKKP